MKNREGNINKKLYIFCCDKEKKQFIASQRISKKFKELLKRKLYKELEQKEIDVQLYIHRDINNMLSYRIESIDNQELIGFEGKVKKPYALIKTDEEFDEFIDATMDEISTEVSRKMDMIHLYDINSILANIENRIDVSTLKEREKRFEKRTPESNFKAKAQKSFIESIKHLKKIIIEEKKQNIEGISLNY